MIRRITKHHIASALSLSLSLAVWAPAIAGAADPSLAVVEIRGDTEALTGLTGALADYRVRVIREHETLTVARGDGRAAALEETLTRARALAKEGRVLFDQQDPVQAEAKFRAAADLIEQEPCAPESSSDLVEDYLFLAQIFFATDRAALVREVFRRVVQLAPDLTLDRTRFSPQLVKMYESVRGDLLVGPLGTLRVEVDPGPADVTLDGRARGSAPLEILNLPLGIHRLCVRRDGFEPWFRPVDVTSFRVEQVKAELVTSRLDGFDALFTNEAKAAGDWLDRVADSTGAAILAVGRRDGDAVELRLYSRSRRAFSAVERFPRTSSDDARAAKLLSSAVAAGWIPPSAARKSLLAGGGALDDSAPLALRVGAAAGVQSGLDRVNFPKGPEGGFRVAVDRRLSSRALVSIESGLELRSQGGIILVGRDGKRLSPGQRGVSGIDLSIPLDATLRWYGRFGTWTPFASAGAGLRADYLMWDDTMEANGISSGFGIGASLLAGGGVERAIGPASTLCIEGRATTGRGVHEPITLRTGNAPDRRVPVRLGTEGTAKLAVSIRRTF